MVEIKTIQHPYTFEVDKIKGSRFIGDIAPANTVEQALDFVASIREREPTATHHCWAFALHDGNQRSSDDGEPSGTGGPPILRHLLGADLVNVVAVVTRYFGGTKLGPGGLIRAYGGTTATILETAPIHVQTVMGELTACFAYPLSGIIDGVLNRFDARLVAQDYGMDITLTVEVPIEQLADLRAALFEAAASNIIFGDEEAT